MLPPYTENKHLSFGLEYLCKMMKKAKERLEHQQGEHRRTTIHQHLNSEQKHLQQLPCKLPSCCSASVLLFMQKHAETHGFSCTAKQECTPPNTALHCLPRPRKPITSRASCSDYQAAEYFMSTDFIPLFASSGGRLTPCK